MSWLHAFIFLVGLPTLVIVYWLLYIAPSLADLQLAVWLQTEGIVDGQMSIS